MTLCAMSGLGASNGALKEFRDSYSKRLHLWKPDVIVHHWQDAIGKPDAYPSLLTYFRSRIDQEGRDVILEETLGVFLPGVAMDAFHPMIRMGYAVDFDSIDEITAALAYMTIVHRDVPVSAEPLDLAGAIGAQTRKGKVGLKASRFGESIHELIVKGLYPLGSGMDLRELATVSLDIYQATRNFFALHLVTVTQAIRCSVPERLRPLAVQSMTGALLASHLVLGSPEVRKKSRQEPGLVPGQLDPEHACKYAWACLSEYRYYGDERYLSEIEILKRQGLLPDWVATR